MFGVAFQTDAVFSDTRQFSESRVFTNNKVPIEKAIEQVLTVADRTMHKNAAPGTQVPFSADVRVVVLAPTLTEDKIGAVVAGQQNPVPSPEMTQQIAELIDAKSSPHPLDTTKIAAIALRSAPSRPKYHFETSD